MSSNNWKFTAGDFKGISPEKWTKYYETWIIIKEMGHELLMTFWPNGNVTYGTPGTHDDTEAEQTAVGDAMREWKRRNSSFLENVKAHPPLGARASVERGVEIDVIITAGKQRGS